MDPPPSLAFKEAKVHLREGTLQGDLNPLTELMLLDSLREHAILGSSQQRTVHPHAMTWPTRAVDSLERVLTAVGIATVNGGSARSAVVEEFLRLEGYDHPRPELESWKWLCERAGASLAVREGKEQIVNGSERLRGLVIDAALSAVSMWIDEKLDEVSNMLRNEANIAATKVSAAAMIS